MKTIWPKLAILLVLVMAILAIPVASVLADQGNYSMGKYPVGISGTWANDGEVTCYWSQASADAAKALGNYDPTIPVFMAGCGQPWCINPSSK